MPLVPHVSPNTTITSAWGNLVADHVVMRFTTAAQRSSQLTAPILNQLTTLDDRVGVIQRWTGSAWVDLPVVLERFYTNTYTGNVGTSPQEISHATFTMPFTGSIIVQGHVRWDTAASQSTTPVIPLLDVGPTSTPVATTTHQWSGPALPANNYYATVPCAWKWSNVAAGTAVNLKIKYSAVGGTVVLSHVALSIRIISGEF